MGGDDRLIGGPGADSLDGGDGDDSLIGDNFGATGAVNAATGRDLLFGRAGNDTLVGDNSARPAPRPTACSAAPETTAWSVTAGATPPP
ncbi:hypothetical protein [Streptomyces mirabilis]|uniref:hypothetical protein n=1 Tax=Streptomyces mirabilis TaxID=68239 RepID=UPI0036BF5B78